MHLIICTCLQYHQNQTAIIRAVIERQVDILRLLLEGGGKAVVNEQDKVYGHYLAVIYICSYMCA